MTKTTSHDRYVYLLDLMVVTNDYIALVIVKLLLPRARPVELNYAPHHTAPFKYVITNTRRRLALKGPTATPTTR